MVLLFLFGCESRTDPVDLSGDRIWLERFQAREVAEEGIRQVMDQFGKAPPSGMSIAVAPGSLHVGYALGGRYAVTIRTLEGPDPASEGVFLRSTAQYGSARYVADAIFKRTVGDSKAAPSQTLITTRGSSIRDLKSF